jgi:hypothetical protein
MNNNMIIHIEGFDQNNDYISKNINVNSLMIQQLEHWAQYDWFKDGVQLESTYNNWEENGNYEVMFNNDYINIYIKNNNKLLLSPYISKNITIGELKDILSIKDNIYFQRKKLNDNQTLDFYNIDNKNILDVINIYALSEVC